jgi:hypothetical protein
MKKKITIGVVSLFSFLFFYKNIYASDINIIKTAEYNGHVYYLLNRTNTWQEAENGALSLGGHLVTINDSEENDWILATFQQVALDALKDELGSIADIASKLWCEGQ